MYPLLISYLQEAAERISDVTEQRKAKLQRLTDFIRNAGAPRLTFICTHNSRRSQLCQVWSKAIARYFDIQDIETYSGGTEVTAFHPNAVDALRRAGFQIDNPGGDNPRYKVSFDDKAAPIECFSKKYDHEVNPLREFAAVMTCSQADRDCPFVPGTTLRVSLSYEDPKVADGTPEQEQVYDERSRQIATEMYYMMQQCGSRSRNSSD